MQRILIFSVLITSSLFAKNYEKPRFRERTRFFTSRHAPKFPLPPLVYWVQHLRECRQKKLKQLETWLKNRQSKQ